MKPVEVHRWGGRVVTQGQPTRPTPSSWLARAAHRGTSSVP